MNKKSITFLLHSARKKGHEKLTELKNVLNKCNLLNQKFCFQFLLKVKLIFALKLFLISVFNKLFSLFSRTLFSLGFLGDPRDVSERNWFVCSGQRQQIYIRADARW